MNCLIEFVNDMFDKYKVKGSTFYHHDVEFVVSLRSASNLNDKCYLELFLREKWKMLNKTALVGHAWDRKEKYWDKYYLIKPDVNFIFKKDEVNKKDIKDALTKAEKMIKEYVIKDIIE